jgi:xylulokinase
MFCHAAPERWFHMGVTLAAGGSLRWLRDVAGAGADYPALLAEAASVPPGADGLLFAPYLAGERTPHDDPLVRGGFVGLDLSHGRGHLVRAVLEGVAMSLRDVLALLPPGGAGTGPVLLSGGGARAPLWVQIVADVLGRPVARLAADEGPALGAALLAGVGAGLFADVESASRAHARLERPVAPGRDRARYDDLYRHFVRLYPALRALARPQGPSES